MNSLFTNQAAYISGGFLRNWNKLCNRYVDEEIYESFSVSLGEMLSTVTTVLFCPFVLFIKVQSSFLIHLKFLLHALLNWVWVLLFYMNFFVRLLENVNNNKKNKTKLRCLKKIMNTFRDFDSKRFASYKHTSRLITKLS